MSGFPSKEQRKAPGYEWPTLTVLEFGDCTALVPIPHQCLVHRSTLSCRNVTCYPAGTSWWRFISWRHPCHAQKSASMFCSQDLPQLSPPPSTPPSIIQLLHIQHQQYSTPALHLPPKMKSAVMAIACATGVQAFVAPRWVLYVWSTGLHGSLSLGAFDTCLFKYSRHVL